MCVCVLCIEYKEAHTHTQKKKYEENYDSFPHQPLPLLYMADSVCVYVKTYQGQYTHIDFHRLLYGFERLLSHSFIEAAHFNIFLWFCVCVQQGNKNEILEFLGFCRINLFK